MRGAIFSLEIRTSTGQLIYAYREALKVFLAHALAGGSREQDAAAAARLLVERAVEGQPLRQAATLPEYQEGSFEFESNEASLAGRILVPRELYLRIRVGDGPVFEHDGEWEVVRLVVFDPATGQAIAVLEAWL